MRGGLSRVFPGSKLVWIGAVIALLAAAVVIGRQLVTRDAPLTGTNSVDVAAVIGQAAPGKQACVRDLVVPSGTGRLQLFMGFPDAKSKPVTVTGTLRGRDGQSIALRQRFTREAGEFKSLALPQTTTRAIDGATLCISARGHRIDLGGASVVRIPGAPVTTINGVPQLQTDVSVLYLSPDGLTPKRFVARLDDALTRATRFVDYPGGALVLWVCLGGFLLAAYLAARVAATIVDNPRSPRRLAAYATLVALGAGLAWALMMPAFYGADESEHFAYAQHLAATNHRAAAGKDSTAQPYSTDEVYLLGALHHNSTILNATARPRWDSYFDDAYKRATRGKDLSDADGGGYTESASGHAPLYYEIVGLPYRALHGHTTLPRVILAMRVLNVILASLVAGIAVLIAALLLPKLAAAWWLAGMLVAGQPVFNSVSATINNDTLVNLFAALSLLALIHAWVRGPTPRNMVALGVFVGLLPIAKVTGFALWPVAGVGGLLIVLRHRGRAAFGTAAIAPAVLVAMIAIWVFALSPALGGGRGSLFNSHTAVTTVNGSTTDAAAPVAITPINRVDYALQMVVPFVHLKADVWAQKWPLYSVYVERGYGRFGWLNAGLTKGVLVAITIALLLGWGLAIVAAFRYRARWREWAPGMAILALSVLAVFVFVAYAYVTLAPRPVPGEQGRYAFPALTAMAVLVASGLAALPGRARQVVFGAAATVMPLLGLIGWLAAVRGWFT